jgi:hypothetical protein
MLIIGKWEKRGVVKSVCSHYAYWTKTTLNKVVRSSPSIIKNVPLPHTILSKYIILTRLVIGTSRTVGSAKKFVRITSGFGGGEFTKTLRKVCTCQKLKFAFLLLEYCKIRECYAVANAFTIRNMYSLLLYMKCNSRKINRPAKNMTKIVTLLHF